MELERAPRAELLKTIEQQKELIQRREQRLRGLTTLEYFGKKKYRNILKALFGT